MMILEKFPIEILLLISDVLDVTDINVLAQTCKSMLGILEPLLYQRARKIPNDAYKSRFLYATIHGQASAISKFLKAGVSISVFKRYTDDFIRARTNSITGMSAVKRQTSKIKFHPLLAAALFGHIEVVTMLLNEDDVDVDFHDRSNKTALRYATEGDHLDVIKLLLKKGATIIVKGNIRNSSFILAADVGNKIALEMMFNELNNRSTPEKIMRKQCETACYLACVKGFASIVDFLLSHGVDVNLHVRNRRLLYWASHNGSLAAVKALVIHGARMEKERDCGIVSALYHHHRSQETNNTEPGVGIVMHLLESGCNVANGGLHACALWRIVHASGTVRGGCDLTRTQQNRIIKLLKKNGFDQKKCRNKCWEGEFNKMLEGQLNSGYISDWVMQREWVRYNGLRPGSNIANSQRLFCKP
jgi:ankyrin repeat protein